jgi:hypothetical protein
MGAMKKIHTAYVTGTVPPETNPDCATYNSAIRNHQHGLEFRSPRTRPARSAPPRPADMAIPKTGQGTFAFSDDGSVDDGPYRK